MSARNCGCDPEARWTCKYHVDLNRMMSDIMAPAAGITHPREEQGGPIDSPTRIDRFTERLLRELAREPVDAELTPLDESLIDAQRLLGTLATQMSELARRVETLQDENAALKAESQRRETVLEAFKDAERDRRQAFRVAEDDRRAPEALQRVRDVLATFYRAELSMSSVAPVLALAEELNPGLSTKTKATFIKASDGGAYAMPVPSMEPRK